MEISHLVILVILIVLSIWRIRINYKLFSSEYDFSQYHIGHFIDPQVKAELQACIDQSKSRFAFLSIFTFVWTSVSKPENNARRRKCNLISLASVALTVLLFAI